MSSQVNPITVFTTYPWSHIRRSRWFYPVYDGTWLAIVTLILVVVEYVGFQSLVPNFAEFRAWYLLAILPLAYLFILCHLITHNVVHRSLPKAINRLVGEICALLVLTRYASWEIVHLRHHRYSDIPGKDPHDCRPGYWNFLVYIIGNVERQLQENFYDYHGGPTKENQRFERYRALLSFFTGVVVVCTFARILGLPLFLLVFLPAQLLAILHLAHFNWSTHNGFSPNQDYHPVNLDHGLYWLGNRIFFGIYYHANHHQVVGAFNPMNMERWLEKKRAKHASAPVRDNDDDDDSESVLGPKLSPEI